MIALYGLATGKTCMMVLGRTVSIFLASGNFMVSFENSVFEL